MTGIVVISSNSITLGLVRAKYAPAKAQGVPELTALSGVLVWGFIQISLSE
jgi:hypothetical protein